MGIIHHSGHLSAHKKLVVVFTTLFFFTKEPTFIQQSRLQLNSIEFQFRLILLLFCLELYGLSLDCVWVTFHLPVIIIIRSTQSNQSKQTNKHYNSKRALTWIIVDARHTVFPRYRYEKEERMQSINNDRFVELSSKV